MECAKHGEDILGSWVREFMWNVTNNESNKSQYIIIFLMLAVWIAFGLTMGVMHFWWVQCKHSYWGNLPCELQQCGGESKVLYSYNKPNVNRAVMKNVLKILKKLYPGKDNRQTHIHWVKTQILWLMLTKAMAVTSRFMTVCLARIHKKQCCKDKI